MKTGVLMTFSRVEDNFYVYVQDKKELDIIVQPVRILKDYFTGRNASRNILLTIEIPDK